MAIPICIAIDPDEALRADAPDLGRGSSAGMASAIWRRHSCQNFVEICSVANGAGRSCGMSGMLLAADSPPRRRSISPRRRNRPYGFKPTDLIVDRDGSLLIADWGDGQRPKRGRGRIYRITSVHAKGDATIISKSDASLEERLHQLDSSSYFVRTQAQQAIDRQGQDGLQALRHAMKAEFGICRTLACHLDPDIGGWARLD